MNDNININDSNITTELTFRNLVIMRMQQLTNFPYIEEDFDALTDYQLLCLVVKHLNDVIQNQNEQNSSITSLYQSFLSLQDYVNTNKDLVVDAFNDLNDYVRDYFANLDVQEEINNKLDGMVEDGTLENIIANYLNTQIIFNTHDDLINSTSLVDGINVQTLGYHTVNDDGGAFYKVTSTPSNTEYQEQVGNLYLTLIKDRIKPEIFGAYGDSVHDDSASFQTALSFGEEVYLSNKTYIVNNVITKNAPNIIMLGDNTTIKSNLTSTDSYGHDYFGIISDDDLESTPYYDGGNVILKNIKFDGNASNITSWTYKGFGFINVYKRDNIIIENCDFENILYDALSIGGLGNNAIIKNCRFNNVGMYEPTGSARRNAISCSSSYFDRVASTNIHSTKKSGLFVSECNFKDIADECIAPRNIITVEFKNNNCENIGQHIVEAGNNYSNSEYNVNIENCSLFNVAECLYTNGGDAVNNTPYKGYVTVSNVKGKNMAWNGSSAIVKREAFTMLITSYTTDVTKEADILIKDSIFESVTPKTSLTDNEQYAYIIANNIKIENSKITYPYIEYNNIFVPQGEFSIKDSLLNIGESKTNRYIFLNNDNNKVTIENVKVTTTVAINTFIFVRRPALKVYITNLEVDSYYILVYLPANDWVLNTVININNSKLGASTGRLIHIVDGATNTADAFIVTNNILGTMSYGSVVNGNATFKSIINNSNYNIT